MNIAIGIQPDDEPARLQSTLDSIARHTAWSERVVLIPDSVRGGAARLNWLLGNTTAPAVILLESGCVAGPGALERLVCTLESSPRSGLAGPSTNVAWNEQRAFAGAGGSAEDVAATAAEAERRFGTTQRTLAPLYSLADFCYAVRRDVWNAVGPADESYGNGPIWEMDFNIRAARAGFDGLWVCAAYVWRPAPPPERARQEAELFAVSRRRYQDKFCGARLRGEKTDYRGHCRGDACPNFAPHAIVAPSKSEPVAREGGPDLVSCIMPTYNRRRFIARALKCFLAQDYPSVELIVVDDGSDAVADLIPTDARIRYIRLDQRLSVGAKRNLACEQARGTLIAHWDDDDWYPPDRISRQVAALREKRAHISGSSTIYFYQPARREAYVYRFTGRPWVAGTTLLYRRDFWQKHPFPDVQVAEDSRFVWDDKRAVIADLADPALCIASIHRENVSPKSPRGLFWTQVPLESIRSAAGATSPPMRLPLVSCVLLTQNRRAFLPLALACYDAQSYPNRELIVLDDGDDAVGDLFGDRPDVRYLRVPRMTVGAKRNAGCEAATGDVIAFWDDDDWFGSRRIAQQVEPLVRGTADVTALPMRFALELPRRRFWTATDELHRKMFACDVAGGTSVFPRGIWTRGMRFANASVGEDGAFLRELSRRGRRVQRVDGDDLFVYVRHGANTWAFGTGSFLNPSGWRELPRPDAFSTDLLEAYAAAAAAHAQARRPR